MNRNTWINQAGPDLEASFLLASTTLLESVMYASEGENNHQYGIAANTLGYNNDWPKNTGVNIMGVVNHFLFALSPIPQDKNHTWHHLLWQESMAGQRF